MYDSKPKEDPPVGFDHDITLVAPASNCIVEDVRCPVPGLGWMSQPDWKSLQGERGSKIKFLGGDSQKADVINMAGRWTKEENEKVADKYFDLLERRAGETTIGRAAKTH